MNNLTFGTALLSILAALIVVAFGATPNPGASEGATRVVAAADRPPVQIASAAAVACPHPARASGVAR